GAALTLATLGGSAQAQTTVTTTTVDQQTVTRVPSPQVVTTDIEFQPAATANDLNVGMLRDFESVKQEDRSVATEIARNPNIVENGVYVAKHPALQAFLEKYPDARNEIIESPGNFVTPVSGSKWNSHEVAGIPRD
ncbi:MAG TPA: hypothetical protein VKV03_14185, partial [Candidatus Binataceae bacterium]|nr:hypothetical protein [Candidatus Binataceae bacterium]